MTPANITGRNRVAMLYRPEEFTICDMRFTLPRANLAFLADLEGIKYKEVVPVLGVCRLRFNPAIGLSTSVSERQRRVTYQLQGEDWSVFDRAKKIARPRSRLISPLRRVPRHRL